MPGWTLNKEKTWNGLIWTMKFNKLVCLALIQKLIAEGKINCSPFLMGVYYGLVLC